MSTAKRTLSLSAYPLGPWTPRRTEVWTITPKMAQYLLDNHNPRNRRIRPTHVKSIAMSIAKGHWVYTGAPIIFDSSGNLIDGQHRLLACIEAGSDIEIAVAFGSPLESFDAIDINISPRNVADILRRDGIPDANAVAAVLNVLMNWESGLRTQSLVHNTTSDAQSKQEFLAQNSEVIESVSVLARHAMSKFAPRRTIGAVHYLFGKKDTRLRDEFFDKLHTGVGMAEKEPTLVLRERLLKSVATGENRSAVSVNRGYNPTFLAFHSFVQAWNHVRNGTQAIGFIRIPNKLVGGRLVPVEIPEIL